MTPQRRGLFMEVLDGYYDLLPLMHLFDRLTRCDELLSWLKKNNLKGQRLKLFFFQEMGASPLNTAKYVISQIDREKVLKPIVFGKDYM